MKGNLSCLLTGRKGSSRSTRISRESWSKGKHCLLLLWAAAAPWKTPNKFSLLGWEWGKREIFAMGNFCHSCSQTGRGLSQGCVTDGALVPQALPGPPGPRGAPGSQVGLSLLPVLLLAWIPLHGCVACSTSPVLPAAWIHPKPLFGSRQDPGPTPCWLGSVLMQHRHC